MRRDGLTRDGRYRLTLGSRIRYGPLATRISNAWYRAAGHRIQGARQGFSNWRNQCTLDRGKRDLPARAGDQVRSRTPVLRSRINRGTGRPHRDDRDMGRLSDQSLARMAPVRRADRASRGRSR
jgi:hypothetical protein